MCNYHGCKCRQCVNLPNQHKTTGRLGFNPTLRKKNYVETAAPPEPLPPEAKGKTSPLSTPDWLKRLLEAGAEVRHWVWLLRSLFD